MRDTPVLHGKPAAHAPQRGAPSQTKQLEDRLAAAAAAYRAGASWHDVATWHGWRSARAVEEAVRVRLAPQEWQRRRGPKPSAATPSRPAWRTVGVRHSLYERVQALAASAGAAVAACVEEALLNWLDYEEARTTGVPPARTPKTGAPAGGQGTPAGTAELARGPISEEGEAK